MPSEEKKQMKKVQCWITIDEWEKIETLGYTSPTTAVSTALAKLLEDPSSDPNRSNQIQKQDAQIKDLRDHNETLKRDLEDLKQLYSDPGRSDQIQTQKAQIQELSNHNETLKQDLEDLKQLYTDKDRSDQIKKQEAQILELRYHNESLKKDIEDLKQLYNNYMMQMQTLINQKVIEAPGAKKPWWRFW